MTQSATVLLLEHKIKLLEEELSFYRATQEYPFINFRAYIKGIGELAYYYNISQLSVYKEAKIFDDIIDKLTYSFVNFQIKRLERH